MGVSRKIQGCSERASWVFRDSVKCVPRIFFKNSRVFKNVLMEFCFCDFVVAWISSQLPEKKKGLLYILLSPYRKGIYGTNKKSGVWG